MQCNPVSTLSPCLGLTYSDVVSLAYGRKISLIYEFTGRSNTRDISRHPIILLAISFLLQAIASPTLDYVRPNSGLSQPCRTNALQPLLLLTPRARTANCPVCLSRIRSSEVLGSTLCQTDLASVLRVLNTRRHYPSIGAHPFRCPCTYSTYE